MGWIKWTGKVLEFTGKLAQTDSFEKWASSQGEKIVTNVGLKTGGYVFGLGRDSKAKGLIWSELESIARTNPELNSAIQDFVKDYPEILGSLASRFDRLPHRDVDLCVVPGFLVTRNALVEVKKRLGNSKELADLKGGESFRDFFFGELVDQLGSTYAAAAEKASPNEPIELHNNWIVGFNPRYEWKGEHGHYFVYSDSLRTASGAKKEYKKEGKKEAAELLKKCLSWLGTLTAEQREQWESKLP